MIKYTTYSQAKKDVLLLNNFITLVEEYEVNCITSFIIKSYSETSSIPKVIQALNKTNYIHHLPRNINKTDFIKSILKSNPEDQLHRIVHEIYKSKTKRKK